MAGAWDTYNQQLVPTGNGHAVWDADPGEELAVEIADVGYFLGGTFLRLFNVSKEIGDLSNAFGTPDGYKPIRIGTVVERSLSASRPITSESVEVDATVPGGPKAGGGFIFECTEEREGAALILGQDADRRDAQHKAFFIHYIIQHHNTWLRFANDIHHRAISLDQLLMVTGCDKTSEWACVAFSPSTYQGKFCVRNAGIAQGGFSRWGWLSGQVNTGPPLRHRKPSDAQQAIPFEAVNLQHDPGVSAEQAAINLPEDPHGIPPSGSTPSNRIQTMLTPPPDPATDETSPPRDQCNTGPTPSSTPEIHPRNQCIFLRGFKIAHRTGLKRCFHQHMRQNVTDDGFMLLCGSSGCQDQHEDGSTKSGSGLHSQPGSQDSLDSYDVTSETDSLSIVNTEQPDQEYIEYSTPLTHLDVLMGYILENSSADLALVHHDDLAILHGDISSTLNLEKILGQVQPHIFVENGIGMLESTFEASQEAESTISQIPTLPPPAPEDPDSKFPDQEILDDIEKAPVRN
ncbi:hypothetical protein JB92DRAFT_3110386 [Gautieria morchelliformis]|nr:hypothetical protein JB92DRAFT_3110386 [Gautieria morchelliformis]